MKRLVAILIVLILAGCGGAESASVPAACPGLVDAYEVVMVPLIERWDAAVQAADRTASAQSVEDLRTLRAEAAAVVVDPCLAETHGHMLGSMDATVAGFNAALTGRPQAEVEAAFVRAEQELGLFDVALRQAMRE